MILTIAIPTYNRPEKLKETVLDLLPQLTGNVRLMILDNHSDVVIKDYLQLNINLDSYPSVNVIRHNVNIGGDANFIRCFELCDTPYIWTLGDDDKVMPDAVELILKDIETYKNHDLIGFNFNSNNVEVERNAPCLLKSLDDFLYKLDSFGNCETLSTSVYKTEEYSKFLRYAAWASYSMASQFVPAIMALSQNKVLVLSEKYIVNYVRGVDDHAWSDYQLALGITSLLELPIGLKKEQYKAFGKMTNRHFDFIWPISVLYCILNSVNGNINLIDNYHIYIYKELVLKGFEFRTQKLSKLIQYYTCLFFLRNKAMLKLLLKLRPGIKTRALLVPPFNLFKRNTN